MLAFVEGRFFYRLDIDFTSTPIKGDEIDDHDGRIPN